MNKVIIDAQLPSLNEYVRANRSHWSKGAEFKQSIESLIGFYIRAGINKGTLHPIQNPCEIYIEWHEATRRRDCDNIQSAQKYILDAFQHFKIIKNDNRRYVRQIHHLIVDDNRDFVEIEIKENERGTK